MWELPPTPKKTPPFSFAIFVESILQETRHFWTMLQTNSVIGLMFAALKGKLAQVTKLSNAKKGMDSTKSAHRAQPNNHIDYAKKGVIFE